MVLLLPVLEHQAGHGISGFVGRGVMLRESGLHLADHEGQDRLVSQGFEDGSRGTAGLDQMRVLFEEEMLTSLLMVQESFDPIIDVTTRQDLLPKMIYAQSLGEFDFQGIYSILLKHK